METMFILSWTSWIWIAIASYLLYRYMMLKVNYFEKMGIPHEKGIPIFGTVWNIWNRDLLKEDLEKLKKHGTVWGEIMGKRKVWVIADPNLIKKICIKEFESFSDRPTFVTGTDKYISKFISLVRGQQWKDIRNAVSPGFSSGKIKSMCHLMQECSDSLKDVVSGSVPQGKISIKSLYSGYAIDIVASCAFGIKIDSLKNPDNEFYGHLKNLMKGFVGSPLLALPFLLSDKILPYLPSMLSKNTIHFYKQIVENIIENRQDKPPVRNDFLDAMLEIKKSHPKHREVLDDVTLVAQSMQFFFAGFDTINISLTNLTYFLADNPEKQEKLHDEIIETVNQFGEINYESLAEMKYLEACIYEGLRLGGPAGRLERIVTKTVTIDEYTFEEGFTVAVPIYAIHHSDMFYEDPDKFEPERFLTMDKEVFNSIWMPFGVGPRNCIAIRFALQEMKFAISKLIQNFRVFKADTTPEHLVFLKGFFGCLPVDMEIGIEARDHQ